MKSKCYRCSKTGKTFSGLQNGAVSGLQIGAHFRDYKSEKEGLQIGVALVISNRDKKITNQGRDFKSGQRDFKSWQRLQIGARGISNRGRNYKSVRNSNNVCSGHGNKSLQC